MNLSKKEIGMFFIIGIIFIIIPFLIVTNIPTQQNIFELTFFKKMLIESILLWLFFIFNYVFLIPKLYFKKNYILYVISLIFGFFIIYKVPDLLYFGGISNRWSEGRGRGRRIPFTLIWISKLLFYICIAFIPLFIRQNIRLREVKEEKQLSEIAYLRAQINPHFLFNTLNSIYALTLQKSDNASDAVMKLSKMMRYVVSDSSKDLVPLQQDLDYIKNYIQLQQLRIVNKDSIHFTMTGNFSQLMISPLLLINFIENAFKYGIVDDVDNPIKIDINIVEGQLEMKVNNTISGDELMESEKSETGISNTKKRLDYIYTNKYDLVIDENKQQFTVKLKIDLND